MLNTNSSERGLQAGSHQNSMYLKRPEACEACSLDLPDEGSLYDF